MTTPPLTPLTTIPAFTEPILAALQPYWITTAEEFAATTQLENPQFGDGLAALGSVLQLGGEAMDALYAAAVDASPRAQAYTSLIELEVGAGLLLDGLPRPAGLAYAPPVDLPSEVLIDSLPPILDQGRRNTCVAFTMVTMYQLLTGDFSDLSEQLLFWGCKQLDGLPNDPRGTDPQAAIRALMQYGVCLEADWPYQPEPMPGNVSQDPPPPAALTAARSRRLQAGGPLDSFGSAAVCSALADGQPVLLGLRYYPFWANGGQARRAGRVRPSLPGELYLGGHAVCAVGYRDDPEAPGGGYIIFRNSWGEDWGEENVDGAGYGHAPYALIDSSNLAAYVLDAALTDAP